MSATTDHEHTCPHCGRLNDAATGEDGTRPGEGDVSICWKCGGIGIFTGDGQVRLPTEEELREVLADPRLARLYAAIHVAPTPLTAADVIWGSS